VQGNRDRDQAVTTTGTSETPGSDRGSLEHRSAHARPGRWLSHRARPAVPIRRDLLRRQSLAARRRSCLRGNCSTGFRQP